MGRRSKQTESVVAAGGFGTDSAEDKGAGRRKGQVLFEGRFDDGCFDDNTTVCFCDSDTTQFLYEVLCDWRNNMWDDATQCASYDSYDSDTTQIFDENDLLVVIPPAAVGCRRAGSWPTKLPCGHEFVSIK